jgi:hypothetical protein
MGFSLQWGRHLIDVVDGGIVQGAVVVPQAVPHRRKWFSNHVQDPPDKNYKGRWQEISEFLIIKMVQQACTGYTWN